MVPVPGTHLEMAQTLHSFGTTEGLTATEFGYLYVFTITCSSDLMFKDDDSKANDLRDLDTSPSVIILLELTLVPETQIFRVRLAKSIL